MRRLDQRHRLAVDGADRERQGIDAFDATEIDAVAVPAVLAVGDIDENAAGLAEVVVQDLLVPQVVAEVARLVVRREVGGRNVARRQDRAAPQAERANQLESQAVALRPQATDLRRLRAPCAFEAFRKVCGIGLQSRTREEVIAETRERAWELAETYVMVNYRDEYGGGWKHPLIGSQDQTPIALDSLSNDRFIVGNPGDCIAQLKRFEETFGVDHLICRLYFAGMPHDHIMTELKLLAQEVFPAFR